MKIRLRNRSSWDGPSRFEPDVDVSIPCSPRAPSEARRAVESLSPALDPGALRDAQLVVSELVTNSVRHSGSDAPIRLRGWVRPNGVKFEVVDGGFGFDPAAGGTEDAAESGRGLQILRSVAERWGVNCDARTRVWFEISGRPVSGARAQAG